MITKEGDAHYYSAKSAKEAEEKAKQDGLTVAMVVKEKPCGE